MKPLVHLLLLAQIAGLLATGELFLGPVGLGLAGLGILGYVSLLMGGTWFLAAARVGAVATLALVPLRMGLVAWQAPVAQAAAWIEADLTLMVAAAACLAFMARIEHEMARASVAGQAA